MDYTHHLKNNKDLIAMIHLPPLPGTPLHRLSPSAIMDQALTQACLYRDLGVGTVMIENMHDRPYTRTVGPEITALMAIVGKEIKELGLFCGVQILAGCNKEALAVAHTAELDFVRVEGFVFGHLADEGYIEACAGSLLRYRRSIGAGQIPLLVDIKKNPAPHPITADVHLAQMAQAARFFLADGVIVTGAATGLPADPKELQSLSSFDIPLLVGSGITPENIASYYPYANGFIVGSSLKSGGRWENPPDPQRVQRLLQAFSACEKQYRTR